jgi:hypothetical protein
MGVLAYPDATEIPSGVFIKTEVPVERSKAA